MSRRGREGAPSDDVLLRALDLLVAAEGIVEAGDLLGVNYRTAAKCLEERHVSRRMRQALEKHMREQTEQEEEEDQPTVPVPDEQGSGEDARLQEPDQELSRQVGALQTEVSSLRERLEMIEGRLSGERDSRDDGVDVNKVDNLDGVNKGERPSLSPPRRVFPELITEDAEEGEEQVYGAAAETVVEWREAWAGRKSARYTVDWLRAERRRLELELRLIGVFGLTPPPADAPWRERRLDAEVVWRRRALRRLRWQIPLTWCLHWLLRAITLGLWGRPLRS